MADLTFIASSPTNGSEFSRKSTKTTTLNTPVSLPEVMANNVGEKPHVNIHHDIEIEFDNVMMLRQCVNIAPRRSKP